LRGLPYGHLARNAKAAFARRISAVHRRGASSGFSFNFFLIMKNQKLVSDHAYPAANLGGIRSFDTLSRILVALMCAAVVFFALLLVPLEFAPLIEEILGWCIAGLAAILAFIVVVGLVEQLAD
jgi:mannose/fructose/N-acetylgalactosamine-specific phosphotransferase system component IIC